MQNQIQERLKIFQPEYREFLASDFISETTTALAREENLSGEQLSLFQNAIGLYLLCFMDVDETINFLSTEAGLSMETASPLVGAVLNTLPNEVVLAIGDVFKMLNTDSNSEGSESVSPVRTMENDKATAQEGQAYTSSQDALLKNKKDFVPKPNDAPHA